MHLNWRGPLSGPLEGILPQPGFSADAFIQAQVFGRKHVASLAASDAQTIQVGHIFRQQFTTLDVRAGTGTTVTRDAQGFIVGNNVGDSQIIEAVQIFGQRVDTTAALQLKLFGPIIVSSLIDTGLTASESVETDANKQLVSATHTGTGSHVRATSPTLVTPVIGAATGTSLVVSTAVYAQKLGVTTKVLSVGSELVFTPGVSKTVDFDVVGNSAIFIVGDNTSSACCFCISSYKASAVTLSTGSDAMFVNSSAPSAAQVGIWKTSGNTSTFHVTTGSGVAGGISITLLGTYAVSVSDPY